MDLLTKMRLRLKSSIDVISLFLQQRTALTIFGSSKISFQPILCSGSFASIRVISSIISGERPWLFGIINLRILSSRKYSATERYLRPWSKKGYSPLKAIRQSTTPSENTSILEVPSLNQGNSGAMQMGVPLTEKFSVISGLDMSLESPKSAILKLPLWRSMFSGLISLCTSFELQST